MRAEVGKSERAVDGRGADAPEERDLYGEIVRRIVAVADPCKIVLFGSSARDEARSSSDIDILVIMESSEPRHRRSPPLYGALSDIMVPMDIMVYTPDEVTEWAGVRQAFVTTALREGKILHEKQG